MSRNYILLIIAAAGAMLSSCREDITPPAPDITLDSESGIYTVKSGRTITIAPTYTNAGDAEYSWTLEGGEKLSDAPVLEFMREETGRYYIVLTVSNAGGSAQAQIRIDVQDITPPTISLPGAGDGFVILQGTFLELRPTVASSLETTYSWSVDGSEVSTEPVYTFVGDETGDYLLRLETVNEDGSDAVQFTVSVKSPDEVDFSWTFLQTEYNISLGRRALIRVLDVRNAFDAVYTWYVDGSQVQTGGKTDYVFTGSEEGQYEVRVVMENAYLTASQTLTVNVCPPEGTYRRPGSSASFASVNKVYEFLPAPGQFVNEYYEAATMEEACRYAEGRMAQTQYVSLGGFGGFIVAGFDHSVENDGDYNIAITGNAFDGSSEPGIVWVMQDENGDGLPNDTWYELKGSEYGKAETDQDYAVTYFRPEAPAMPVTWTDNRGNTGTVEYLGAFHRQDYYYPTWVEENSYTLRGTCLKARNYDASGNGTYWVNPAYGWGYADNFSSIDRLTDDDNYNASPADNHFRISDAVTFDGKPAGLAYIDFVKVQVGVNASSGWLGEVSTEIFDIKDFNLLKTTN